MRAYPLRRAGSILAATYDRPFEAGFLMWQRNLLAIFILGFLIACDSTSQTTSAPTAGEPTAAPISTESTAAANKDADEYLIGTGDQLQITVWQHPDLSPAVVVLPDGEVSLPLIGELKALGLAEHELAAIIREKLSEYVRSPEVTVTVINPSSAHFQQRVRVTGAVLRPASVPFHKGMTILDVVLESGGPSEFASANKTKLYRTGPGGAKVLKVYLDDILKKGKMETNYELQPSDVVSVPERLF
jgi:polysaccharide biosynthesis/export protein